MPESKPTLEQLLRLIRQQGYTPIDMMRGWRALNRMDANPGMPFEKALDFIKQLDQGNIPAKAGGQ